MTRFNINSYIISRNRTCRNTTQFQDELDKAMNQQSEATEKIRPPQRSTNVATLIEASR
ncbi:MAG: hypothetical protein HN745_30255 [Deltaproteobacteria bacterium]|jgi:hypothetical protein|nr:hypothetical protein [Deltaproteobacteria bacterium]